MKKITFSVPSELPRCEWRNLSFWINQAADLQNSGRWRIYKIAVVGAPVQNMRDDVNNKFVASWSGQLADALIEEDEEREAKSND